MNKDWMRNYDHLSVAQIIIDLASLHAKKRAPISLQETREVLDVFVDRATAVEGVYYPAEGEFFNILSQVTAINKLSLRELYKSKGVFTSLIN